MLDLDPHQVEVDLAEDAVLQMELTLVELELDVQALFDADLHLDWSVCVGLLSLVGHDELFLLGDAVVVSVDHHVDIVPQLDNNAIISLELLLYSIELKVI